MKRARPGRRPGWDQYGLALDDYDRHRRRQEEAARRAAETGRDTAPKAGTNGEASGDLQHNAKPASQ